MNKKEISELKKQFTPDNWNDFPNLRLLCRFGKRKNVWRCVNHFFRFLMKKCLNILKFSRRRFSRNNRQKSAESGISTESRGGRRRAGISAAFLKNSRLTDDALVDEML